MCKLTEAFETDNSVHSSQDKKKYSLQNRFFWGEGLQVSPDLIKVFTLF